MARTESDREDLIREATALKQRVEWDVPGESEPVVTGFKRDGSLSVYFGQDPVYQFNPAGQLRRAYVDDFLYRTQGDTLARLHRERTADETTLVRQDLTEDTLAEFVTTMRSRLTRLTNCIDDQSGTILRQVIEGNAPDFAAALHLALNADPWLAVAIPTRRV
jgi:hypothetical protein